MLYEFECKPCGNREDLPYPISSAPALGTVRRCTRCGGNTLRRIPSLPSVPTAALTAAGKYPYVSHRHSNEDLGGGLRQTETGHPIIESARHEREIMARTGMVRD